MMPTTLPPRASIVGERTHHADLATTVNRSQPATPAPEQSSRAAARYSVSA
jgi:hypothetical protein